MLGVYRLGKGQTAHDVLKMQADLLRSEGIAPTWVPIREAERAKARASLSANSS